MERFSGVLYLGFAFIRSNWDAVQRILAFILPLLGAWLFASSVGSRMINFVSMNWISTPGFNEVMWWIFFAVGWFISRFIFFILLEARR